MARKTAAAAATDEAPARRSRNVTPSAVLIKGGAEWREWLDELTAHCRLSKVDVIDQALAAYAKQVKFPKPAPRRTEGR